MSELVYGIGHILLQVGALLVAGGGCIALQSEIGW